MFRPLLIAVILSFVCISASFIQSSDSTLSRATYKEYTFSHDGYKRTYYVYKPHDRVLKNRKVPLLFVLHGGGGVAKTMPYHTKYQFHKLANKEGFIIVFPQGVDKQWNGGRDAKIYPAMANAAPFREQLDDVGFLTKIVSKVSQIHDIDPRRIFTCGMSNGGFMSNRLVCERPDIFRAAGVVTAQMDTCYVNQCNPGRPVSLMIFNGTADKAVPYHGGDVGGKRGHVISTQDYVNFWLAKNNCSTYKNTQDFPDKDGDGVWATRDTYENCKGNNQVILYTIHGGGHTWPGIKSTVYGWFAGKTMMEINAAELLWEFFKGLE